MARIRTIKPEFPQSESMGRVSRDARLLFIQLWTVADDLGRLRGNSRMLASLLYPYDDDAPSLIGGWIDELEREGCVVVYEVEGNTYMQIQKWEQHQKVDKPTASRLPEYSREFAKPRENSSRTLDLGPRTLDQDLDLGPRTKDLGPGRFVTAVPAAPPAEKPALETWRAYSAAYEQRYGALPKSNATVMGQVAAFVKRIGREEAPLVAAFFVEHNGRWYAEKGHAVSAMLADAEKLRTEWATGRRITTTQARQGDRLQATGDIVAKILNEAGNAA